MDCNKKLKIAFFQHGGNVTALEAVSVLLSSLERAQSQGAQLIVYPELFIHGYCIGELFRKVAEPMDGPVFQAISAGAKKHGIHVVYSYAELDGDKVYNSVQVVDRNGVSVLNYRKVHLWGEYERTHFTAGDSIPELFDIDGVKLSVLICYDIEFPEPCRVLAIKGADVVLVPTACVNTDAHCMIPIRAFENHIFVVYCNRVGAEGKEMFAGESIVAAPDGTTVYRASGSQQEFKVVDLDLNAPNYKMSRWRIPYLQDRRPEVYAQIALPLQK